MSAPNIVNVGTITGASDVQSVSTTITAITTNSAASNQVYKVNCLWISNIHSSNPCDVTVDLYRSSTSYRLASTITVPAYSTLMVITKDTAIYLAEGDSVRCQASANSCLQAICSYEILS